VGLRPKATSRLQALREDILFTPLLAMILMQDRQSVNFPNMRYNFRNMMGSTRTATTLSPNHSHASGCFCFQQTNRKSASFEALFPV
jgi:hypothetical protein